MLEQAAGSLRSRLGESAVHAVRDVAASGVDGVKGILKGDQDTK